MTKKQSKPPDSDVILSAINQKLRSINAESAIENGEIRLPFRGETVSIAAESGGYSVYFQGLQCGSVQIGNPASIDTLVEEISRIVKKIKRIT